MAVQCHDHDLRSVVNVNIDAAFVIIYNVGESAVMQYSKQSSQKIP